LFQIGRVESVKEGTSKRVVGFIDISLVGDLGAERWETKDVTIVCNDSALPCPYLALYFYSGRCSIIPRQAGTT
jgi:hypothetical protein